MTERVKGKIHSSLTVLVVSDLERSFRKMQDRIEARGIHTHTWMTSPGWMR